MSRILRLILSLCLAMTASMAMASAADIAVEAPWARAAPAAARTGAVYMTLVNRGDGADRLLAATSPLAGKAELHTHVNDQGVMRMRPVTAIELPPGATVALNPNGLHIMLLDLKGTLTEGTTLSVSLRFEKGGTIEVSVPVRRTAAPAAGHQHRHGG